jgi:hypothetical protein
MTVRTPVLAGLFAVVVCVVCGLFAGVAVGKSSEHKFEIVPGSFHFTPSSYQAGAHADWVTSFDFAHEADGQTYNDVRNIAVTVPAGFDASNTAVPTCTQAVLLSPNPVAASTEISDCPIASQVGKLSIETFANPGSRVANQMTVPVYNMEITSYGVAAELGFKVADLFTQILQVSVRPNDVGLTAVTPNVEDIGETRNIKFTLWGIPGSHEHDAERGMLCGNNGEIPPVCRNQFGSPQQVSGVIKPFLSNPSGCGMFKASMSAFSWQTPDESTEESAAVGPIVECERVKFEPAIEANPSTRSAESPTGLDLSVVVPQTWENQFTIATSNLMDTTVTLPEGMTANPSLAAGLGACSVQQYEKETSSSLPGEGCPPESKIGSISIETPLLAEKIPGSIYIATPYENVPEFGDNEHPNGSLLALYIVAKDPERGLLLRVAGKITPNPVTGQLVTTFARQPSLNGSEGLEGLPQQPFSKFTLEFRSGETAPLVSPPTCGNYTVNGQLTPWSAPTEPRSISSEPFQVTQGVHEGPCPPGGVPPFKPQVVSGTQNNAGGSYSPFYLRIIREDGEQELIKFSTTLPPGLTGNLTGIPFCPEASIEAAKTVTGGEEEEHPSCPPASEIGHTLVEAGVGTVLAQNPGKIYLAGPYHGAPLSIVSITSAKVGPFDLGTVVIRFALDINPITAQVEVSGAQSDPIPHIIKGIIVHVRDIRVYMDRHNFTLNPTNCAAQNITDAITGSGSNPANPAGQDTVNVSTPFQAADCASLAFKPEFQVSTSGRTSRSHGASLTARLTMPGAMGSNSNIKAVKVDLPRQLPSRLSTLQKACPDSTFDANPAACPADSVVGHAKALTPVLPVPLEGPAYFVSHGGAKFPELIVVLQGYGFTIDLHGETFISKAGITSSTFRTIPDQPVTSFELTLPEGTDSALAANGDLCTSTLTMPTAFVAQNGATIKQSTPIEVTGCKPAIKIISHHVKGTTITILTHVPSAGRLTLAGKGLSTAVKSTAKAANLTATLKLTRAEQALLKSHPGRKLTATVALRFKPRHGATLTNRVTVLVG